MLKYVRDDDRNFGHDGQQQFTATVVKITCKSYPSYLIPCSPLVKFRITKIFSTQSHELPDNEIQLYLMAKHESKCFFPHVQYNPFDCLIKCVYPIQPGLIS